MSFTSEEINRISGSRLAVYNRKYYESNGNVWIGTADNRLTKLYIKDKNIGVELYSTNPTISLQSYLKELKPELTDAKEVEVDFGDTLYQTDKVFTITDNDLLSTDKIIAQLAYKKSSTKSLDDVDMDIITLKAACSDKTLFLSLKSQTGSLYGKYIVTYFKQSIWQ